MTTARDQEHLFVPLQLKALDEAGSFSGYAAVFGGVDSQNDSLKPGAFARSLAEHKSAGTMPALLWMHDAAKPVGAWQSVREDEKGLRVSGRLTLGTAQADEAYALLRDGAVTGLSIGYKARQSQRDAKTGARLLTDVDLKEISLVALPANAAARVEQVKGEGAGQDGGKAVALIERITRQSEQLRQFLEVKGRTSVTQLWAPPFVWGTWVTIGEYNVESRFDVKARSISNAPGPFGLELRYYARSGSHVTETFSGPGTFMVRTAEVYGNLEARAKAAVPGQMVDLTVTQYP